MGEAMCKYPLRLRASRPPFDALRDGEVRLELGSGSGVGVGQWVRVICVVCVVCVRRVRCVVCERCVVCGV